MLEKFEVLFKQLPTDEEKLRAKRELPDDLRDLADRDLKRVVLDPEKSAKTIRKLVVLALEPDADGGKEEAKARAMVGGKPPVHAGPEVGIEPCIRITIGFIWPCGTLRIGGCS